MKNKAWIILKNEYMTRVKSKGFIIGTILGPVIMLGLVFLPSLFAYMSIGGPKTVYIYDATGEYGKAIIGYTQPSPVVIDNPEEMLDPEKSGEIVEQSAGDEDMQLVLYEGDLSKAEFREMIRDSVVNEMIYGYVIIESNPESESGEPNLFFYSKSGSDFVVIRRIERMITDTYRIKVLDELNVDRAVADQINKRINMTVFKLTEKGEEEESGFGFILAFGMGFIIYMSMFIYGGMTMQSAMEEKQSRIVEVIISSVRPFDLLMGKILGIGLLGLTQYVIWGLAAGVVALYGASIAAAFFSADAAFSIPIPLISIFGFILYFVFGYLIFATLYAAIGAAVDNMSDAQQLASPIMFLIIIPILLISLVIRDPNSTIAVITSQIPFFSPILMTARIAIQPPPLWEWVLSFVLMIGTIVGAVWFAAKIYRVGVLMYGKKVTFNELVKWLKY